jgi:hypothetical protein
MPTSPKTVLSVAAIATLFLGTPFVVGNLIDKATAHQCLTHDWPEHLHQNHLDFCDEFGYPSN